MKTKTLTFNQLKSIIYESIDKKKKKTVVKPIKINMNILREKIKSAGFPKYVKVTDYNDEDNSFYLSIPFNIYLSDAYDKLAEKIEKWTKETFHCEEWGGGSNGDIYELHYGPMD